MRFWPVRERKAPIESVSLPARPPDGDGASSLDRPWSVAELWIGSAVVLPFWVVVYLVGSVPLQALVGPTWDYASPILSNAVYVAIAAVTASMFLWSRKAGLKVLFGPALSLRQILLILAGLAAMLAVDLVWVALMPPVSPAMPTPGPAIPLPEPWSDWFFTLFAASGLCLCFFFVLFVPLPLRVRNDRGISLQAHSFTFLRYSVPFLLECPPPHLGVRPCLTGVSLPAIRLATPGARRASQGRRGYGPGGSPPTDHSGPSRSARPSNNSMELPSASLRSLAPCTASGAPPLGALPGGRAGGAGEPEKGRGRRPPP